MTTCCTYAMIVMLNTIVSIHTNNQSEIIMNDMSAKRKPLVTQDPTVDITSDGIVVVSAGIEPNVSSSPVLIPAVSIAIPSL